MTSLESSRALWNRNRLDLNSDEVLAQILDRGSVQDWRALYRIARTDCALRKRMTRIVLRVPIGMPRFWLAALRSLGEDVDLGAELPQWDD